MKKAWSLSDSPVVIIRVRIASTSHPETAFYNFSTGFAKQSGYIQWVGHFCRYVKVG